MSLIRRPGGGSRARHERNQLYAEAARGRLGEYLDANPDFVTSEAANVVALDLRQAVDARDLGAASLTVQVCAEILDRLNLHREAVLFHIQLFQLQLDAAGSLEEYTAVRRSALAVGARAQDGGWVADQVECWLLAIEAGWRAGAIGPPAEHRAGLITAMRDLADLAELIARQPLDELAPNQLRRFTAIVATLSHALYSTAWDESALLGLRALLSRTAHAGERVIPKGLTAEIYPDPDQAATADAQLSRLFLENDK